MKLQRFARATALALISGLAVSSASAESLVSALASAYSNNPEILASSIAAQSAAEGIVAAKAGLMPNLGLDGTLGASAANTTDALRNPSGGTSTAASGSVSLGYSQTLFDNGATDAAVEAARAQAEAAIESSRNTEQSVLLSAAQAYVNVVVNSRILALRQDAVDYYQAQVRAADDRLNVGEGTQTEVAQAQAQLAQALANQQGAASSLAVAEANYIRYVGHAPKDLSFTFPFENKLPTSVEAAIKLAQTNHPGLRAAEASVRAAKANADAAQAAFGPTLSTSGALKFDESWASGSGSSSSSASIQLKLSVPIYSGGKLGANARAKNLSQINAEMTAQSTNNMIRASIAQAWSSLKTSAATIAAVKAAENATQKVLDATTEEFGVGQKTQLDVLNAKSNLTDVQITRINAESGRFIAALSLLSAVGRMSATDLGLPVEVRSPDAYRAKVEDVWQDLRAIPN